MKHLKLLVLLFSIFATPIQAQIEQCEILHLTDAVVISEYLPRSLYQLDSLYIEGNHYIYHNGRKMIFKFHSNFNKYLTDRFESDVYIPECLHTYYGDPILDYLNFNYSYDCLKYTYLMNLFNYNKSANKIKSTKKQSQSNLIQTLSTYDNEKEIMNRNNYQEKIKNIHKKIFNMYNAYYKTYINKT